MDIPLRYGIINTINNNEDKIKQLSYNGYEKKSLLKKIENSWDNKEYELSYYLMAEIHASGYINDYYDICIEYFLKKVILKNCYYSYFLNLNLKKYIAIKKYYPNNQHKYLLINSSEVRNIIGELNNILLSFEKNEIQIKLEKNFLSEEIISKRRTTTNNINITDMNNTLLTKNLIIGISEILNILEDNSKIYLDNIIYWLNWLLKAESNDKRTNIEYYSKLIFTKKNKHNDFTYIIWTTIFNKIKNSIINNSCKKLIKSFYEIYYFNYSKKNRKSRIGLIAYAIYYLKNNKKVILRKNIDTLYLYASLKINDFYISLISDNLIEKNRIEYLKIYNEYYNTSFKKKERSHKIDNYKIAKIHNKMEYLNILIYKNKEDDKLLEKTEKKVNNNNLKDDNIKKYFN